MKPLDIFFPKKILGKTVLKDDIFSDRRETVYIVNKVEGNTIHYTSFQDDLFSSKDGEMSFEEFKLKMIKRD